MPSNSDLARQQQKEDHLIDPLMRSFMYGQFANLFKFAYWWVALSPLLYAITNNSSTAIGVGRIVYNTALCLASPLGPLLIEHVSPRRILLGAAGVRFVVWSLLLPLNWVFFDSDFVSAQSIVGVYAMVVLMLVLDGFSVGISSVLDIDFMGIDILAGYLGREVTEEHRNAFNSRNELFFSICFIIFSPAMAFMGLGLRDGFDKWKSNSDSALNFAQVQSGTLSAIFVITFLVATIIQFYYFWPLTPENAEKIDQELAATHNNNNNTKKRSSNLNGNNNNNDSNINGSDGEQSMGTSKPLMDNDDENDNDQSPGKESNNNNNDNNQQGQEQQQGDEEPPTTGQIICGLLGDLKESFFLVISHRAILFRLIFFGFELAFEDASIVVLAAQLGIHVKWLGDGDSVHGSIWTAVIVAVGKLGAALASYLMMKEYHPPENIMGHTKLFIAIGLSTLVIIMIPLAFDGYASGDLSENAARAITLVAFLLYFFLSTLPKLGLMSLLQTMVSQVENGHRAFAFIAILATTIDSVIIMVLSLLFNDAGTHNDEAFSKNLWITTYVFLAHGLLETIFGPILILRPAAEDAENVAMLEQQQKSNEGGDSSSNKSPPSPESPNRGDITAIKPDLLADGEQLPLNTSNTSNSILFGNDNDQQNNSIQANELAGSYSSRAVAVPTPFVNNNNNNQSSNSARGVSNLGGSASLMRGGAGSTLGGVSPRIGGMTPRSYQRSGMSGFNHNRNNNNDGNAASSSVVRQNMLGRSMHSAVAASNVVIPTPRVSRLDAGGNNNDDNNNDQQQQSYVRRGSYRPSASNLEREAGAGGGNSPHNISGGAYGSV